jgi:hypothetical protein
LEEIENAIAKRNLFSGGAPWDFTAFLRSAIREKIAKMERSRAPGKRRSANRFASGGAGEAHARRKGR